jgi:hypothetical protein
VTLLLQEDWKIDAFVTHDKGVFDGCGWTADRVLEFWKLVIGKIEGKDDDIPLHWSSSKSTVYHDLLHSI